ncbi:unnamed protein product [Lampetra planeri]
MVMVANKKSRDQMTRDLMLFLGDNTSKFTAWLHGVLDKLRSITTRADAPVSESREKKDSSHSISHSTVPAGRAAHEGVPTAVAAPPRDTKGSTGSGATGGGGSVSTRRDRTSSSSSRADLPMPSDPIIDITPTLDDLSYDLSSGAGGSRSPPPHRPVAVTTSTSPSRKRPVSMGNVDSPPRKRPIAVVMGSGSPPIAAAAASRKRPVVVETIPSPPKRRSVTVDTVPSPPRKRPLPIGTDLLSLRRRPVAGEEEEEEDEVDVWRRGGGPASSVQLPPKPERKPTLPPSKQANKSLLMKAISEAQESVSRTTSRMQPIQQRQTAPVAPRARPREDREGEWEPRKWTRGSGTVQADEAGRLTYRASSGPRQSVTRWPEARPGTARPLEPKHGLLPHSEQRQPEQQQQRQPEQQQQRQLEQQRRQQQQQLHQQQQAMEPQEVEPPTGLPTPAGAIDVHAHAHACAHAPFCRNPEPPRRPVSPKFIVTLDGVTTPPAGAASFAGDADDDDVTMTAVALAVSGAEVEEMEPCYSESEAMGGGVVDMEEMELSRCRFWPGCSNGEACPFHHPTQCCKTFPNCKFGDRCLYIHPVCRFDGKCSKVECPFTHTEKRRPAQPAKPVAAPVVSSSAQCRFFPECKNLECPFEHPKPCRYGVRCKRTGCVFYHPSPPSLPPRQALKWTKPQEVKGPYGPTNDSGLHL